MTSDIVEKVKSSCYESLRLSGIKLNEAGMHEFMSNLEEQDYEKYKVEHGARFPLKYQDALDELNFLSTLTILNFLSAYRIPLHERTGQGAYDSIRRFMLSAYLSQQQGSENSALSADGMASLTEMQVSDLLKLPIMTEKDHPTLPVKVGERDPEAVEIVGLVKGVMNETGQILKKLGKKDLGTFVADVLRQAEQQTPKQRASTLVEELVKTFPAFADEGSVKGHKVYVYKKAQLLAFIVAIEFKGRDDVPFPLPDATDLPAFVDNVVPTMAAHFKLIDLRESVYPVFTNGLGEASTSGQKVEGLALDAEEAYAIRSATLAACERAVQIAKEVADKQNKPWLKTMTSYDLDGYLWQKAKDGKLRDLPRLSERGTVFY